MEKIRLGKTNMMVSRLGFGGIPIQRVSEEEAIAVVRKCLELGITYLDTANAYSTSEERIGKAIAGRRDEVILGTKSQSRKREGVEKHIRRSLERLGVDYIDLFQFHNVADAKALAEVTDPDGPMAVVKDFQKAGQVRHIGITSHSWDTAKEAVKSGYFETIQVPFNFITCEAAEELLPVAREHDVGFIAMKPLAGGILNNVNIAFKYLFQFPDVVPIPGIEKPHEIEEIVHVLEAQRKMTEADEIEMQRLRDELGTRFCRRCDYCKPCTAEIPISVVMVSSSFEKRMPPEQLLGGWVADAMEKAANCTECGDCEERCPYHLPIREIIKEQVEWYEGFKKRYPEKSAS